ncbi:MAG: tetratricopeptide repeat protein [Planctomycetes bacterium]|nr:tetratricopeptide repeat protein [Planctomycetota bacterium]
MTSQLLTWIGNKNINGAVRLTADLVTDQPDLTQAYIRRLTHALPRPVEAIEHTQSKPASAALAQVRIGLFVQLGAIGEAWQASEAVLRQWPTDSGLLISRIELAATLDEPALVDSAIAAADALRDDTRYMTVFARAWSKVGSHNRALEAARRAVKFDPDNSLAHGALARVLMSYAFALTEKYATLDRAKEAMVEARHAIDLDPGNEEPYEIITTLTGSGRLLDDLLVFNQTRLALHETNPNSRLYEKLLVADDIAQRNYESALERLVNLYESDPTDIASLAQAVIAWTRANRLHDAERWLDEHLAVRPGDPGLLESRVRILLLQSRSDKAITLLKSDLETHPNNRTARRLLEGAYRAADDHQAVLELREPRLRLRPRGTRRELDLASMYADAGRYQQAQERLNWVLAHAQEARRGHLAGALNTARRLEIEESEKNALLVETTMRIVERFPDSPLSVYHVGLVAQAELDADDDRFDWLSDQAANNAIGATAATHQSVLAWRNIGQSLVDIGNPDAAGRALRARLRADPDYEKSTSGDIARYTLAVDAVTEGRAQDTIETIKNLSTHRQLSQVQGRNALTQTLYRVSQIYSLVGNVEGTDAILREVIRLDPNDAMAMNNLSYMRIAANRHDEETIRFMEQAYEMLSTDSNILDSIGWLRYKQGIFEDQVAATVNKSARRGALSLIRKAIEKNQLENPEVMDHLADTLWRLGRKEEAIDIWKQVRTIVDDPARRKEYVDSYRKRQLEIWGMRVKDPEEMYQENEGALRQKVIGKLEAVSAGRAPKIALTFKEADQAGATGAN